MKKNLPVFNHETEYVPKVASMLSLGGTVIVCGDLTHLKTDFVPRLLKEVDEYYSSFNISFHEHPAGFSPKTIAQTLDGKLLCIAGHPETALARYAKKLGITMEDLLERTDYVLYVENSDKVFISDLAADFSDFDFLMESKSENVIHSIDKIAHMSDYKSFLNHYN